VVIEIPVAEIGIAVGMVVGLTVVLARALSAPTTAPKPKSLSCRGEEVENSKQKAE
jgi:hypothetical protein